MTQFLFIMSAVVLLGAGCVATNTTPVSNSETVNTDAVVNPTAGAYNKYLVSLPLDKSTGEPIYCLPNNQPRTLGVPAGYEDEWTTYQGTSFGIAYPEDFVVDTSLGNDYASFTSPDGRVTFHVYSPLWDGSADELLVQSGEIIVATRPRVITPVSCVTQLGESSTVEYDAKVIRESDDTTIRSVADIGLKTEDDTSNVRMTFALEVKDTEQFDEYLELFKLFMSSLVQYADA